MREPERNFNPRKNERIRKNKREFKKKLRAFSRVRQNSKKSETPEKTEKEYKKIIIWEHTKKSEIRQNTTVYERIHPNFEKIVDN